MGITRRLRSARRPYLTLLCNGTSGSLGFFPVQVSPAEEFECQEVRKFEEGTLGTEPAAKEPTSQESKKREQGEKEDPGEDGLQEELNSNMERAGCTLVGIEPLLQSEAPDFAEEDQIMGIRVVPEDIQNRHEKNEKDELPLGYSSV